MNSDIEKIEYYLGKDIINTGKFAPMVLNNSIGLLRVLTFVINKTPI